MEVTVLRKDVWACTDSHQLFLPEPLPCYITPIELLTSSQFSLFLLAPRLQPTLPGFPPLPISLCWWLNETFTSFIPPFTYNSKEEQQGDCPDLGGGVLEQGRGASTSLKPMWSLSPPPPPPPTLAGHSPAQAQNARVCLVSVNQAISCANLLSWHMWCQDRSLSERTQPWGIFFLFVLSKESIISR